MKLHPRFVDYVLFTYPGIDLHQDVVISVDNGDATVQWNIAGAPPTDAEIDAAVPAIDAAPKAVDKIQLLVDYVASKPDAPAGLKAAATKVK